MKTRSAQYGPLQYVAYTYGLFVVLLATLGGVATKLLNGTPLVMKWLMAITAWTSTYVLLLMYRRLCPGTTLKDFYKAAFRDKFNRRLAVTVTTIQVAIFALSVYRVSVANEAAVMSLLDFSLPTVVSAAFFTLIQGPTGEESGWRGYLMPVAEEKLGVIKGSLVVSLAWAFWHAPIWFLDSGYSGASLLRYIVAFVICITSLGFIIGLCYRLCRNLFIPVTIHYTFNFLGVMYTGPMVDLVSWYAVFYALAAVALFVLASARPQMLKEPLQLRS